MKRQSTVNRKTKEVKCSITLNLDGSGKYDVKTGIPFFNHMLEQFSKHGYFDLKIKAIGDTEIDFHHTVEDTGIGGWLVGNTTNCVLRRNQLRPVVFKAGPKHNVRHAGGVA